MNRVVVGCVQLTARENVEVNLARCRELCAQAAERGAKLVVLPENFALLAPSEQEKFKHAEVLGQGPIVGALADVAARNKIWVIGGGMPEKTSSEDKVYNTCVVIDDAGRLVASYRKIHLFDIDIPHGAGGAQFRESATVEAGRQPVLVETPWGRLGLSVCYDLRFPELYRQLAQQGARMIVVPAAFTLHTGKDHWHVLLRARAIENQVFVLAPAQFGRHNEKRTTYGHSLIVDPWGTVIAEMGDREGVAVAELDFDVLERVRREMPCAAHRRL